MHLISIRTNTRVEMLDITDMVQKKITEEGIKDGACICYVPHTTAGITINEGADPAVCEDIIQKLNELVPRSNRYKHLEGNADSHIKATLVGSSVVVIIEDGRLVLGTWQRIFFCEFDGPRTRKVWIKFLK
ncbi:MAG: YjbQ family protein [Deltaproteobacteria bacterium]|nr:MAG: YjbQ family protein [Deltaproteobacteria bacterium]